MVYFFITFTTACSGRKLQPSSGNVTIIYKRKTEVEANLLQFEYKIFLYFYFCVYFILHLKLCFNCDGEVPTPVPPFCIILVLPDEDNSYRSKYFPVHLFNTYIYRVIQEESALLWEMIVWVILSKKVHTNLGPILNGYGVMTAWNLE